MGGFLVPVIDVVIALLTSGLLGVIAVLAGAPV